MINQFISPVKVIYPFTSPEFTDSWSAFKTHYTSVHSLVIRSRQENIMLIRLSKLSINNESTAISMIRGMITTGSTTFRKGGPQ
jgi:hypothetical protein